VVSDLSSLEKDLEQIWVNTPIVKVFPLSVAQICDQENRKIILEIMGKGRLSSITKTKVNCFTGPELHGYIQEITGKKSRLSNTYHHLKILKENDVIGEEHIVIEGKAVKLFKRLAKLFLFIDQPIEELFNDPQYIKLRKFIYDMTGIKEETINQSFRQFEEVSEKMFDNIHSFLELHHQKIIEQEVDILSLSRLIIQFYPLVYVKKNMNLDSFIDIFAKLVDGEKE